MPMSDGTLERRIRSAAPQPDAPADALERLVTRKRRRAVMRRVGTIATVVVVIGGTLAAFAAIGAGPATQPASPSSPTGPVGVLGLPYPVCDISTMPITTPMGPGSAAVFTSAENGCPTKPGSDAFVGVGVDLNGDGTLDATTGPVPDCYISCEAFAAPDVNGDGTPVIAVSDQGADGYGISLYALTTSPPSIAPITKDGGPFQFAWAGVATHANAAHCETTDSGEHALVLTDAEFGSPTSVDSVSYSIQGTIATKVGEAHTTVPLDQAPVPTEQLCGVKIHGSAGGDVGNGGSNQAP
jgi:hypothetical protein